MYSIMLLGGISWNVEADMQEQRNNKISFPKFLERILSKNEMGSIDAPTLISYRKMDESGKQIIVNKIVEDIQMKENLDTPHGKSCQKELDNLRKELHDRPDLATMVGFPPYEWRINMGCPDSDQTPCETLPSDIEEDLFNEMVNGGHIEQVTSIKRILGLKYSRDSEGIKKTQTASLLRTFHQTLKKTSSMSPALKHLALKSLALIAPTCEALVKSRKHQWIQLSGHAGSFFPAGPDTVWKKRLTKDNNETMAYKALMSDSVAEMVPKFYAEVEFNKDYFIEIEDLLQHFDRPCVMDIKMGCRTFLESEVQNQALRKDLFEKMVKLDPQEPTAEENAQQAITKLRYMKFREWESSTSTLAFRIEGVKLADDKSPYSSNQLKKTRTFDEVTTVIQKFAQGREDTCKAFLVKLTKLRSLFSQSAYFKHHEIIGSSLLFMYDERRAGVWMIDFAKTCAVERTLSHDTDWRVGNNEDGYLTGLDNLIKVFEYVPL